MMTPEDKQQRTITYVGFGYYGHHATYIDYLCQDFKQLDDSWHLRIWVPAAFERNVSEIWSRSQQQGVPGKATITFVSYETHPQTRPLVERATTTNAYRTPWWYEVVRQCADLDEAHACFIPQLELCVYGLTTSLNRPKTAFISGIYFLPRLHYITFPLTPGPLQIGRHLPRAWLQWAHEYYRMARICQRSDFVRVLTNDPLAPSFYNRLLRTSKFHFVPDPVIKPFPTSDPRCDTNLPAHKTIYLIFGGMNAYKGVLELLQAFTHVCKHNETFRTSTLLILAGVIGKPIRAEFQQRLQHLNALSPEPLALSFDRYLPEEELSRLISASDIICVPYRYPDHRGMSAVLLNAAAYGHPIVGTRFSLVGELIRRYNLGIGVDCSDILSLATALQRIRDYAPALREKYASSWKQFTAPHTPQMFARTVRETMVATALML